MQSCRQFLGRVLSNDGGDLLLQQVDLGLGSAALWLPVSRMSATPPVWSTPLKNLCASAFSRWAVVTKILANTPNCATTHCWPPSSVKRPPWEQGAVSNSACGVCQKSRGFLFSIFTPQTTRSTAGRPLFPRLRSTATVTCRCFVFLGCTSVGTVAHQRH